MHDCVGAFIDSTQFYQQGDKGRTFDYERDIAKLVSFTKEYFDPIPKEDEIRICIADYDLPVKTARQELLDAILLAESVGAVKAALYHYDPSLFQVKTHDAMKYMQLATRKSGVESTILEFSRSMRASHYTRSIGVHPCRETSTRRPATCYPSTTTRSIQCLISYKPAKATLESPLRAGSESPLSKRRESEGVVMCRYLARYCYSLTEHYQVIDAQHLPFDVEMEIDRVIKQWVMECIQEL